jgi:hypothetical protein
MASQEWNNIDKQVFEFENYYYAFLDILGYRAKSELFFENKYNLPGRIERALRASGMEANREESPDGIITEIFSDSIMLRIKDSSNSLGLLLNYTAMLTTFFSYEGLYLRGGISRGKLYENNTGDNYRFLSSEGLIKAYELETQAVYPMIVIDDELVDFSTKNIKSTYYFKNNDKTGLNFARFVINEKGDNEKDVVAELEDILNVRNSITSKTVVEKYDWLIEYYLWHINLKNSKNNRFNMELFEPFKTNMKVKFEEY